MLKHGALWGPRQAGDTSQKGGLSRRQSQRWGHGGPGDVGTRVVWDTAGQGTRGVMGAAASAELLGALLEIQALKRPNRLSSDKQHLL